MSEQSAAGRGKDAATPIGSKDFVQITGDEAPGTRREEARDPSTSRDKNLKNWFRRHAATKPRSLTKSSENPRSIDRACMGRGSRARYRNSGNEISAKIELWERRNRDACKLMAFLATPLRAIKNANTHVMCRLSRRTPGVRSRTNSWPLRDACPIIKLKKTKPQCTSV